MVETRRLGTVLGGVLPDGASNLGRGKGRVVNPLIDQHKLVSVILPSLCQHNQLFGSTFFATLANSPRVALER